MDGLPIFHNERDIEVFKLIEYLKSSNGRFGSVLDVGCASAKYHRYIRDYCVRLDGVDVIEDKEVTPHLNLFYHDDFLYRDFPVYDHVVSISYIEHVGVRVLPTTLYRELQLEAFAKMLNTASKGVFLTFPYGEGILHAGRYYNQNAGMLKEYRKLARLHRFYVKFYGSNNPTNPKSWRDIPQSLADRATNGLGSGITTVCIVYVVKRSK